jgi:hypothetical protein
VLLAQERCLIDAVPRPQRRCLVGRQLAKCCSKLGASIGEALGRVVARSGIGETQLGELQVEQGGVGPRQFEHDSLSRFAYDEER